MKNFISAYLPSQGREMLRQLSHRLQELGQTPLLLWMLCSVFNESQGQGLTNLGSVFQRFTEIYDIKLKQDVATESRKWWPRLLQELAWRMTCGDNPIEIKVAVEMREAKAVLVEFLRDKVPYPENCVAEWLEDLLNHHLLQRGVGNKIEFRHQLIQEYYTAERLLQYLPELSSATLKRDYLNYVKWTEPLALMLNLVTQESRVLNVVKLALTVDWKLGSRLAGSVNPQFQHQTVCLINNLDASPRPLGMTRVSQCVLNQ
ncbi:hypothetical protein [Acaryochloris sp. IP29b_bin.137]|uniref:NACHT domain-containing protein n=1 Tax=Acaryochloris sp. IP29b_bin.137 TaxID=2969217 RepID=UPI00261F90B2|nr:hypothetical protein [Acaryochloris sp. IP29b_bin.137]